jgi:hypothetical protein
MVVVSREEPRISKFCFLQARGRGARARPLCYPTLTRMVAWMRGCLASEWPRDGFERKERAASVKRDKSGLGLYANADVRFVGTHVVQK